MLIDYSSGQVDSIHQLIFRSSPEGVYLHVYGRQRHPGGSCPRSLQNFTLISIEMDIQFVLCYIPTWVKEVCGTLSNWLTE